ncbi:hypothetical protein COCC4DRAFT_196152 [Bipolaris maydis ATCC 48331]|uniref:Uncharacterized protein n=1 Tax=Cochliobolus heterostrophus (strain C4 / ATCC 48331 / race T) TaxID=665024 RepID=N4XIZ6_COCH4|nr:uncharacterized protein COCC4DRAFT_196152 [Bipolaris maydis ATCC 48331]ENI05092.1 hypothetical protein COCC4DRAFT_196152 [Bipolaris maydis ATCC 48331]
MKMFLNYKYRTGSKPEGFFCRRDGMLGWRTIYHLACPCLVCLEIPSLGTGTPFSFRHFFSLDHHRYFPS